MSHFQRDAIVKASQTLAKVQAEERGLSRGEELQTVVIGLLSEILSALKMQDTQLKDAQHDLLTPLQVGKILGLRGSASTELMHKIGVIRVGPKGGRLRVRRQVLDNYLTENDMYSKRIAS